MKVRISEAAANVILAAKLRLEDTMVVMDSEQSQQLVRPLEILATLAHNFGEIYGKAVPLLQTPFIPSESNMDALASLLAQVHDCLAQTNILTSDTDAANIHFDKLSELGIEYRDTAIQVISSLSPSFSAASTSNLDDFTVSPLEDLDPSQMTPVMATDDTKPMPNPVPDRISSVYPHMYEAVNQCEATIRKADDEREKFQRWWTTHYDALGKLALDIRTLIETLEAIIPTLRNQMEKAEEEVELIYQELQNFENSEDCKPFVGGTVNPPVINSNDSKSLQLCKDMFSSLLARTKVIQKIVTEMLPANSALEGLPDRVNDRFPEIWEIINRYLSILEIIPIEPIVEEIAPVIEPIDIKATTEEAIMLLKSIKTAALAQANRLDEQVKNADDLISTLGSTDPENISLWRSTDRCMAGTSSFLHAAGDIRPKELVSFIDENATKALEVFKANTSRSNRGGLEPAAPSDSSDEVVGQPESELNDDLPELERALVSATLKAMDAVAAQKESIKDLKERMDELKRQASRVCQDLTTNIDVALAGALLVSSWKPLRRNSVTFP
eukprot:GHVT01071539.1.p1 GENE.GHVT01071539.1~~GHVT01071539.1.p1  ORF type:complete len:557 (+),score=68.39 GHVT01071539.1:755-2425(+)